MAAFGSTQYQYIHTYLHLMYLFSDYMIHTIRLIAVGSTWYFSISNLTISGSLLATALWIGWFPYCNYDTYSLGLHMNIPCYTYIQSYIHAHIHKYVHTCMHTYIHTCTYMHTHIRTYICKHNTLSALVGSTLHSSIRVTTTERCPCWQA